MAESSGVLCLFIPHSSEGFHATNNQFQKSGSMGFVEHRVLANKDLYWRIDLPGVSKENLTHTLDKDKRMVLVMGEAPSECPPEEISRSYFAAFGLVCQCCEISDMRADFRDGVLRMVLKRLQLKAPSFTCGGGKTVGVMSNDPVRSTPVDGSRNEVEENPYVCRGSKKAYETMTSEDGGLFVRIDMPGVAKEDSKVLVADGEVRFSGLAQTREHDTGGHREYMGSVSLFPPPLDGIEGRDVKFLMKDGVLRIKIPPYT